MYKGYTANQWSNWITIYSPVVLKGTLPSEHLRCWLLFVRACCILKSHTLRKQDVITADMYLVQFAELFNSFMVLNIVLQICIYICISCNAYWTTDHHMHFGAMHLRDTMAFLDQYILIGKQLNLNLCVPFAWSKTFKV